MKHNDFSFGQAQQDTEEQLLHKIAFLILLGYFIQKKLAEHGICEPYILYVGTLEPRKNIVSIIQAFDILKKKRDYRNLSLIIGGNFGWLYEEVESAIQSSSFHSSIKLLGPIEKDFINYLYNGAEVFVYPSFFEGFGFPPLEAQACGVPVIASNRTSLPEILKDSAILVDPWRIDDLVLALEEILGDEKLKDSLKEKGLENIKRFSWDEGVRGIFRVWERVLGDI